MNNSVNLYILIATHDAPAFFNQTISSFNNAAFPPSFIKFIIIENGEKNGVEKTTRMLKSEVSVDYLYSEPANKSVALNKALNTIPDDGFVLFMDDDIRFNSGLICAYHNAVEQHGAGYYYGGPIAPHYDITPPEWMLCYLPHSAKGWSYQQTEELKYFFGCNWGAFKKDLQNAGMFDEDLGPGNQTLSTGQESNMQKKLFDRGVRPVYVKDALVYHYVPEHRCSFEWAIKRKFKDGKYSGMQDHFLDVSRSFLGYPIAIIKELIARLPKFLLAKLFMSRKQAAPVIFDFYFRWGRLIGHRYRRVNRLHIQQEKS